MTDLMEHLHALSMQSEDLLAQYILDESGVAIVRDINPKQESDRYEDMSTCVHAYVKSIMMQALDLNMDTAYHWAFSMPEYELLARCLKHSYLWIVVLKKDACLGKVRYLMQLKANDLCQILS